MLESYFTIKRVSMGYLGRYVADPIKKHESIIIYYPSCTIVLYKKFESASVANWKCCSDTHTIYDPGLCMKDKVMEAFKCPLQVVSTVQHTTGTWMRTSLLTCKEIGLHLKSMPPKNISSYSLYFRRLVTLNSNHITGFIQLHALFTSDQASLL